MSNEFDPYREALVVETETVWPEDYDSWEPGDRLRVETLLHSAPSDASELEYVRVHTGFCRQITVTPHDLERLGS
jgi:hypothetical protein